MIKKFIQNNKFTLFIWFSMLILMFVTGYYTYEDKINFYKALSKINIEAKSIQNSIQNIEIDKNSENALLENNLDESSSYLKPSSTKVYTTVDNFKISQDGSVATSNPKTNNNTENKTNLTSTENLSITLKVNNKQYLAKLNNSSTVYDLMEHLQEESDFKFSGVEYDYLGFFVESIANIKNDPYTGKYWIYYVNNKKATMGISNRLLKNNDVIEWKYEQEEL
ncbi:MAG: DUF4430 domain-containing protein [Candidatus Magasanikbacteria bacterium]|nr:DUF4430 domain-containing protein [Candidatus Magasanikbacteria bacterium]